ncbi:MAG: peroxiredoxin-like family protein [Planctomycetota bacterium]|jgi:peroxiredoxin
MTLAQILDDFKATMPSKLPPAVLAVLEQGVADLVATDIGDQALAVGDTMPAFALPDASGTMRSSADLLAQGPLVVSFYRGGWCPYCNLELRALQALQDDFAQHHATLVAISPQNPDDSLSTQDKNALTFPVLSDHRLAFTRAMGLSFTLPPAVIDLMLTTFGQDLRASNGTDDFELPIPATYVVDRQGVVRWRYVNPDYTQRAEPADVLAAVHSL